MLTGTLILPHGQSYLVTSHVDWHFELASLQCQVVSFATDSAGTSAMLPAVMDVNAVPASRSFRDDFIQASRVAGVGEVRSKGLFLTRGTQKIVKVRTLPLTDDTSRQPPVRSDVSVHDPSLVEHELCGSRDCGRQAVRENGISMDPEQHQTPFFGRVRGASENESELPRMLPAPFSPFPNGPIALEGVLRIEYQNGSPRRGGNERADNVFGALDLRCGRTTQEGQEEHQRTRSMHLIHPSIGPI